MAMVDAGRHAQLRSVRRWLLGQLFGRLFGRLRLGSEGTGHLAGLLALIGLAAYGLLIASVPFRASFSYTGVATQVFALVGWALWFASYIWSVVSVLRGKRRQRGTKIVTIVGLIWSVVLFMVLGMGFAAPPALSFSVMLLCLTGRARGAVTIALLIVYFGLTTRDFNGSDVGRNFEEFALSSLIFYAIPRLVVFARDLEDTRSELAQLAVSEQRLRWARDLHDTLGHGLSVVVLKLELVERLGDKDPARASAELRDARALLRESIGEMQSVVAGMRDVSLDGEIANAQTILESAGVATSTDIAPVTLDSQVAETLAWIVREGATNVLRHSDSTHCDICLRVDHGRAVLTLANDGPAIKVTRSPSGGHGIRGMRERLNSLGGRLTAKSQRDGGFVLEASVPLPTPVEPIDESSSPVPVEVDG
ncbi:MAG TPA: sensor histidine kinase [Pseudonocardiaceae bacterium]|nr:sensor histidine kinase [Pseudonocardiaceae bacterium]